MPVAGLALTLHEDASLSEEAVSELQGHASISVGERIERWLSIVMTSSRPKESRDLHEWIESLPGVVYADVVYVGFDQPEPSTEPKAENTAH